MPPEIETDFGDFMATDVNTSTTREAFIRALSSRSVESRRLQGAAMSREFDLTIVYEAKGSHSGGLFHPDLILEMSRFEQGLRSLPEWEAFCAEANRGEQQLCDPGLSFANYAWPSQVAAPGQIVPSSLNLDGKGQELMPLEASLRLVEKDGLKEVLLPKDFGVSSGESTRMLRSFYRFRYFVCYSMEPRSVCRREGGKRSEQWTKLIKEVLLPVLQEAGRGRPFGRDDGEWPLQISFEGTGFHELEVMETLMGDLRLAVGSVVFVLFYSFLHTRSLLLSLSSLFVMMLSVPLSHVVCATITGTPSVSIASFLSLFLVVGLGSDVAFVYTDFWRDSARVAEGDVARLLWTYRHAGKASLATTATTAVSFFANLASILTSLRQFGFFMGLCVMLVWLLLSVIFVPLCILDERCCGCCRRFRPGPQAGKGLSTSGDEVSSGTRFFDAWTRKLHRRRRLCVALSLLLSAAALAWGAASAETETGVPDVFPEWHNQNRGKEVIASFQELKDALGPDVVFTPPPIETKVCGSDRVGPDCPLRWCEVDAFAAVKQNDQCMCLRKNSPNTCGNDPNVPVIQYIVSPGLPSGRELAGAFRDAIVATSSAGLSVPVTGQDSLPDVHTSPLPPTILQDWATGQVIMRSVTQVRATVVRNSSTASCGWEDWCFCGSASCQLPSEWAQGPLIQLGGSDARRLPAVLPVQTPRSLRVVVEVIFGIKVTLSAPLLGKLDLENSWHFDDMYDVRQPWAQRHMVAFCTGLPTELRMVENHCWIQGFRDWLFNQKGERFPVAAAQFNALAIEYGSTQLLNGHSAKESFWVRDGMVKASFMSFVVDVSKNVGVEQALEYQKKWDHYLTDYNSRASNFARGAWHTSSLWVRATAQKELISSTVMTLLIVLLLAFLGMLLFTCDIVLSLFVVLATCCVISGLAWFIIVAMGWAIGPIEVIALIVFVGYAVTYSLHVAHRYGCHDALEGPEEASAHLSGIEAVRYHRVHFALTTIGGAALGSAMTTGGCSVFLLFCTLTIFQKLGGVVLAVTIMSILMALGPLPAVLLVLGPERPGHLIATACNSLSGEEEEAQEHDAEKGYCFAEIWRRSAGVFAAAPEVESSRSNGSSSCMSPSSAVKGRKGGDGSGWQGPAKSSELELGIGSEATLSPLWGRNVGMGNLPRGAGLHL